MIVVDESGGEMQQYIEDCQVCCKPWQVIVTTDDGGEADVELRAVGA